MSDRPGSPVQRVAERLRNFSQLSTQIARVELSDNKLAALWPTQLRTLANSLLDAGQTLLWYADEQEAYINRRHEDSDALVTLAQTAANISTILGSKGDNLEILTHSDPEYVLGVLLRATEDARRDAVSKLPLEEREKWLRWLSWESDKVKDEP